MLLRKTVSSLARSVDRAFTQTALRGPTRNGRNGQSERAGVLEVEARLRSLLAIESFYNRPEYLDRQNALLPRPAPIRPDQARVRSFGADGEVIDLRWSSDFEPLWSDGALTAHAAGLTEAQRKRLGLEPGEQLGAALRKLGFDKSAPLHDKYLRSDANRSAHARWYRHTRGQHPCVVLLHGYLGGNYTVGARLWQVQRLFQVGYDVVQTTLPFHGRRRTEARGYRPPAFPSSDPRFTIEGFRQLVFDHRALFDFLLAGRVASLGVMGVSLGGYSAALLATLEPALQFAVLYVPLASIEELDLVQSRLLGDAEQQQLQRDALRRAHWAISPFARESCLARGRVAVVAGEADLVTGVVQARRLAEHFRAPLSTFPGGHVLQAGREAAFGPVWQLLDDVVREAAQLRA